MLTAFLKLIHLLPGRSRQKARYFASFLCIFAAGLGVAALIVARSSYHRVSPFMMLAALLLMFWMGRVNGMTRFTQCLFRRNR